jgi:hypothetical protein
VFVEFALPSDIVGNLRNAVAGAIEDAVFLWANKYDIPRSAFKQKTVKCTHRLTFDNEQHYSLFSLTFTDFKFRMVNVGVQRY